MAAQTQQLNPFRRSWRTATAAFLALAACLALATHAAEPADASTTRLSNGCAISARGIPACGALMGGTFGGNDDPSSWESWLGGHLGVRRTFYSASGVSQAVATAKADLAKGRLPWVSFKVPYSWYDMARGRGDAWAKDIATRMKALNGPVWVAFSHEPENDGGDILQWKAMQKRLAPIVRAAAPNVGYTIIIMGYHQFYGASKYRMSNMWPATKIDLVGFDIYDHYGKDGSTKHTDMGAYFDKIKAWSSTSGVPWGLAETGISHAGAIDRPGWFRDTYDKLVARGGKAFAYFNTNLNSFQDWRLSTTVKRDRFRSVFSTSPSM